MIDALPPRSDGTEFRRRYRWLALGAFCAFFLVVVRLFQLQVVHGTEYAEQAHENVVRRVAIPTTRGVIRDTHGRIVASSRTSFNLVIVPGRVMPSARPGRVGRREQGAPADSFDRIAETLRLNPDQRTRLTARVRAACTTDDDRSPCWRPILVGEDLSRDTVAEIRQHASEMAGSEVVAQAVRYYPFKNLAAHVLGYVAEIDGEALERVRPPGFDARAAEERQQINPLGYEQGDRVGATGIERAWESYLRGQRGWEERVVDARGHYRSGPEAARLLGSPSRREPLPGRDLRLTLDMDLVQSMDRALRPYAAGAAVAVDVRTGRLLAVYSKPTFDPNDLAGGFGRDQLRETFAKLFADPLRPMLDRVVSGAFQPGSTFKPFSALAALEDKLLDPYEHEKCNGYLVFGRRIFHCSHTHGRVDLRDAIAQSCNIYFFHLAEVVGLDRIARVAGEFGLGQKTGLGVNPESAGRIPTRSWYSLRYGGQFRLGFTLNSSIGEGATTVTPLQLALAYAALANGGTVYSPQVVRAVETSDGTVVQDFPPRVRQKANVAPENLARIGEALSAVVSDPKGTAYPVRDPALDVAGKTGTAQTGYLSKGTDDPKRAWYLGRDHAWFASYFPSKAPEVAVVVLVEHGGSGPTVAAPLAMQILRDYRRLAEGHPSSHGLSKPSSTHDSLEPPPRGDP